MARLALAALALAAAPLPATLNAIPRDEPLPPELAAIARAVAGEGRPLCRSWLPDGSEAPCLPQFAVVPGGSVNARHRAGQIAVTRAASIRLTPDEFALLAGHEIAHWYLGHQGESAAHEAAADRLGAQLACRAGFNLEAGAGLFRYLRPSRVHARPAERRAAVLGVPCADKR